MPNDPNVTTPAANDTLLVGDPELEALLAALDNPPADPAPASTSAAPDGTPQAPAPATAADEFFLRAPTGTVYKTREEAEQGLSQKDALIEDLRTRYRAITNTDPITGKFVPPVVATPAPINYAQNSEKLYDDAAEAVQKGDKQRYGQIMQQFVSDMLQPYMPTIVGTGVSNTRQAVSKELPDFETVVQGEGATRALAAFPSLKQAIEAAEQSPDYQKMLPELYRIEYLVAKSLGSTAQPQAAAPVTTPPSARPTVASTTLAPATVTSNPNLMTAEGRKAILEQGKQKGLDLLLFDTTLRT